MKTMMSLALMCVVLFPLDAQFQNYSNNDVLTVAANSGLRLRMNPAQSSPTIRVLEYGEPVVIVKKNGLGEELGDRIQWIDGSWVKVKAGYVSGWVFDGFITTLSPPDFEDQLCLDCHSLSIPLAQYLISNMPIECETLDSAEDVLTSEIHYNQGITHLTVTGDGWCRSEFVFEQHRLSEVLNLLKAMLVGKEMRQDFEESIVFHEDRAGFVSKIEIGLFPDSMTIEQEPEGLIIITAMVLVPDHSLQAAVDD